MCVVWPQVNYFNETHAVWEPLIERVDDGKRRWNLKLEGNKGKEGLGLGSGEG